MQKFIKLVAVGAAPALALQELQMQEYLAVEAETKAETEPDAGGKAGETEPEKTEAVDKETEEQKLSRVEGTQQAKDEIDQGTCTQKANKGYQYNLESRKGDTHKKCFVKKEGDRLFSPLCPMFTSGVGKDKCLGRDMQYTYRGQLEDCCFWTPIKKLFKCQNAYQTIEDAEKKQVPPKAYAACSAVECDKYFTEDTQKDATATCMSKENELADGIMYGKRACCMVKAMTSDAEIEEAQNALRPQPKKEPETPSTQSGETPSGEKPAGETPSGEKPAGEKPAGEKPGTQTLSSATPKKCCTCQTAWIVVLVIAGVSLIAAGGYMICAKPADDDEEEEEDSEEEETRTSQRSGSHRSMRSGN